MKKKKNGPIILVLAIVILIVGYYFYSVKPPAAPNESANSPAVQSAPAGAIPLSAPGGQMFVFVATTSADQEEGLSGRQSLPADQGMLFVFDQPGSYEFWMKDMNFPLDMVWINEDKTVAGVTADLSPDTYPDTFLPPNDIKYVLEINAGAAGEFGMATGTPLRFDVGQ